MNSNEKSPLAEHRAAAAFAVLESFAALESAMREADHSIRHAAGSDPVEVANRLLAVATANDHHTKVLAHYSTAMKVLVQVENVLQRYEAGKLVSSKYEAGKLVSDTYEVEHAEPTAAAPEVVPFQTA